MADLKIKRAPSVESNNRAWTQVYDDINDIIKSVNKKSTDESRTKGTHGSDGDVRLFKDNVKRKYFIEGKFKDGWAKRELLFSDKNDSTQDESINFNATESYIKPDGSVDFTAPIIGVAPSNDLHLATKKYSDDLFATKDTFAELSDTNIGTTNGHMIKYDSGSSKWISFAANFLTAYAVNDSYTGSSLSPSVFGLKQTGISSSTTIRGVRSQDESTLVITLVEDVSNGAYLKFNVPSPTGIQTVQGYDQVNDNYASAISGNTNLKFNDAWNTGTSTGIFFTVTDSGSDTIISPTIAFPANSDTTYTTSLVDSGDNAIIRLTAGGSGSGNDDLTLVAGTNITLAPSGDNLTITANNTTNYSLVNSDKSSSHSFVMTNTGTVGRIRNIKAGSNITMSTTDDDSDTGYVTVNASLSNATIDVSEVNPLGGYLTYESANIRFIDNGRITWALGRPGSSVTTVTATVTNPSASDVGAIGTGASFGGDVSGTYNNIAVSNDSHTHDTRYYTETELNNGQLNNIYFTESEINTKLALKANLASPTFTGTVTLPKIRLSENADAEPDSTSHAFQVGNTSGENIIIDGNEIMARNNGSASVLHLNADFGTVVVNGGQANTTHITFEANGDIDCLNLKARADVWAYTSSDPLLKDNKELIKNPLDIISKINGYTFDWNEKSADHLQGHDYGVMADEIQAVMPELVTTRDDGVRAVRYEGIIPLLVEAIKQLNNEVNNGVCKCR
jgi:hypothetical protein